MRDGIRSGRYPVTFLLVASCAAWAGEPSLSKLVQDLTGPDARARAVARQLLPRQGVEAVGELIPLLSSENPAIAKASFDVLMDIANEASAPGREAHRTRVTDQLMVLVRPDRAEKERIVGLRLLERLVPPGYDVGLITTMLEEKPVLRDKARTALERMGTKQARTALRDALDDAGPAFQCALLDSLGQLEDEASLDVIKKLTRSNDANVRVAAARGLAWTGDPSHLGLAKAVIRSADETTRFDATDALLRLTDVIAVKGGNWQIAVGTYLEILETGEGVFKDAALAGLGRIGDGSCVPPILAAIDRADVRTRLNGINALRVMQGVDVTRRIVDAYPRLPAKTRLELLTVLGEKRTPHALGILTQAAQSYDPAFRLAALRALSRAGRVEGLEPLAAAARNSNEHEKDVARKGILSVADALRGHGERSKAAKAYVAVLDIATDTGLRTRALDGIAACPTPGAFHAVMAASDDPDLKETATKALIAVAGSLAAAGKKSQALEAYEKVRQLGGAAQTMQSIVNQMRELGAEVDLAPMLGIVTHWWLVGPFELGEQNKGWETPFVGEPNVRLDASYTSGGRQVTWKHVASKDDAGKIDLRANVADRDHCIAYAYTEVTVEKETEAILCVGADDSEKIWVNGVKVFDLFIARPLKIDQDQVPVKLRAGTNTILLKIWQNNLPWAFCLRITAPDGLPIAFTRKTQ